MNLPHDRKRKDVELYVLDFGAVKLGISEWEKEAIIQTTLGISHRKVAKSTKVTTSATQMRIRRLAHTLAVALNMPATSTATSVICRAAYLGGLVKL